MLLFVWDAGVCDGSDKSYVNATNTCFSQPHNYNGKPFALLHGVPLTENHNFVREFLYTVEQHCASKQACGENKTTINIHNRVSWTILAR